VVAPEVVAVEMVEVVAHRFIAHKHLLAAMVETLEMVAVDLVDRVDLEMVVDLVLEAEQ
jgi:hypothetical protein